MTGLLPAILGAAAAVGVVLAVVGVRGTTRGSSARTVRHRLAVGWARLGRRVNPVRAALGAVCGVAVWWLTGWPVAGLALAAAVVVVGPVLAQPGNRELITRLDALAEWTRRIADILTSGAGGLEQAISTSARIAPAPLAEQVAALAVRARTRGLESALWAFARDVDHPAAHRVVASLILRARAGGRGLVDILDELASSLRAEAAMRRQVEADRAKSRTSARALVGIVTAVTVALVVFTYDYLTPFATVAGQLWMTIAIGFFAGGFLWLALLTRPVREPGFLFEAGRGHDEGQASTSGLGAPAP